METGGLKVDGSKKTVTNFDAIGVAIHMLNAETYGAAGEVERQRHAGQREFVESDVMPKLRTPGFEELGFVFGGDVPGDDLFVFCELPEGWSKEATDWYYQTALIDNGGRRRGVVKYEPSVSRRHAEAELWTRLAVRWTVTEGVNSPARAFDRVTGACLFEDSVRRGDRASSSPWSRVRDWLNECYPDWKNPLAYWDLLPVMKGGER